LIDIQKFSWNPWIHCGVIVNRQGESQAILAKIPLIS